MLGAPIGVAIQVASMTIQELVLRSAERHYDTYHAIVNHIGKPLTDFAIGWADNVGGVLMAISLGPFMRDIYEQTAPENRNDLDIFIEKYFTEILLSIGVVWEIGQSLIGEGDNVDMAITAIPLLLSLFSRIANNRRHVEEI